MPKNTIYQLESHPERRIDDPLTEILRRGARDLIQQAVEAELAVLLSETGHLRERRGRRRVVRNGYLPEREIQTGIGAVSVRMPRVHDREPEENGAITFTSRIIPKYIRKSRSIRGF